MASAKEGFVYVLQMEGHDYYKIGRTVNLNQRVSQISPQMPGRLRVCMARKVDDCYFWERRLHEEFKTQRLNGEWFCLQSGDIELIETSLLSAQATALLASLVAKFKADIDQISLAKLTQYARAIYRCSKRVDRRVTRLYDTWFSSPSYAANHPVQPLDTESVS